MRARSETEGIRKRTGFRPNLSVTEIEPLLCRSAAATYVNDERMATNVKPRIYIAGPLFSKAERDFNRRLKQILSPYFRVYLPQEDGGLMVDMIAQGMPPREAAQRVFVTDVDAMETCDVLLIILDGRTVDEGAAFELGFAFARGKQCVALRTDPRQLLATGNNPMIESPLRQIFASVEDLISWAQRIVTVDNSVGHSENGLPSESIMGTHVT